VGAAVLAAEHSGGRRADRCRAEHLRDLVGRFRLDHDRAVQRAVIPASAPPSLVQRGCTRLLALMMRPTPPVLAGTHPENGTSRATVDRESRARRSTTTSRAVPQALDASLRHRDSVRIP
jgi:hypothetical protein